MRTYAVCAMLGIIALGPLLAEDKPAVQIIVLANDATLQGQVQRIDNAYHIRGERGTTVLPAQQVAKVVDSLPEAYAFLRSRANLRDPDERCRLARWCRSAGLEMEAIMEVGCALELRPDHAEAIGLRNLLQEDRAKAARKTPAPPDRSPPLQGVAAGVNTANGTTKAPSTTFVALEGWDHVQSGPLFVEYTRAIQPMLFNGCGTGACHGNVENAAAAFTLRRPYDASNVTPHLTRQNLAQTLVQIDKKEPERSKLLKKALEPHGGATRGPLGSSDSPAYRQLAAWVAKVAPSTGTNGEGVFASSTPPERTPMKPPQEMEGGSGFATRHTPGERAMEAQGPLQRGESRKGSEQKPLNVTTQEDLSQSDLPRDAFGSPIPPRKPLNAPNQSKRPAWLPGRIFGAPKEPPPQTGGTTEPPSWTTEPISKDPYDPALFNRHFHGRKDLKPQ
jgi:hypothetical protein